MNYVIVLDSVACLPAEEVESRSIEILPLTIMLEGQKYADTYNEQTLLEIYKTGKIKIGKGTDAFTSTVGEIRKFILEKIVPKYDIAVCQTIAQAISPIYDHYRQVAATIAADSRSVRDTANIEKPFRMTYMSTGTMAAGQGLVALYADDQLSKGMNYIKYKADIEEFKKWVKGYSAIGDIVYGRHRAKIKGNKTVSLPTAWIASALDISPILKNHNEEITPVDMVRGYSNAVERLLEYCCDRALEGLKTPFINISIAGDPLSLNTYTNFKRLQKVCHDTNTKLLVGVMTLAAAINLGPGCVAVGIAPLERDIEP
ncbi:MAG: DegV family protein [Pseudomonadota bacterium]